MSSTVEPSRSHGIDVRTLSACTGSCRPATSSPSGMTGTLACGMSAGPDDALQLAVRVQAELAAVATDAAHLGAAERRPVVALRRVDPHVAGPQATRDAHCAAGVAGEHVVVQPELGAVRDIDALF